jgi:hypothetical protein
MNERIDKLLVKSGAYFGGDGIDYSMFDANKFAELIVQECAKVCLAQRDPANLNYKPSERFAEAVKQHFGVEE